MYELVKHGVPMKELNIGGIAQKDANKDLLVTKSVYINKEDVDRLVEMKEKYGVENIYFQATPSAPKTELKDVVSKFK
jgi:PTS system mannose-specific IIB component